MKALAIDLFCGLGGWTEGLLAEGYYVVGFDIERHRYPQHATLEETGTKVGGIDFNGYGTPGYKAQAFNSTAEKRLTSGPIVGWQEYPAQLVLQSVLTLHGKQFKDAALIVASPPCQEFSYMAMPWSKAKAKERDLLEGRDDPKRLTALFDACFRIQREACEAAGRHIPLVVENVRGAQKWVGRSRWNFGSFHLWGDVPALMPMTKHIAKMPGASLDRERKGNGILGPHHSGAVESAIKNSGGSWFAVAHNTTSGHSQNARDMLVEGFKNKDVDGYERTHPDAFGWKTPRTSSHSNARKAASAAIAKIPFVLASYIARTYKPQ